MNPDVSRIKPPEKEGPGNFLDREFGFDKSKLRRVVFFIHNVLGIGKQRNHQQDTKNAYPNQQRGFERIGKTDYAKFHNAINANRHTPQTQSDYNKGKGDDEGGKLIFKTFCLFGRRILFHTLIITRKK